MNAVEQRSQPAGPQRIALDVEDYPEILRSRLGENAPAELILLGDRGLLRLRKTALFCSARTPIAHVEPGSGTVRIAQMLERWRVPRVQEA